MPFTRIVTDAIDPAAILASVGSDVDGASMLFTGVVRNHNQGRAVEGVRYDVYEEMATGILTQIAEEAKQLVGIDHIAVVHRVGELTVGDVSVAIAVSSPHRAEAFEACRFIIEEIKKRLPVWKKERYGDSVEEWVEGITPVGVPTSRVERS